MKKITSRIILLAAVVLVGCGGGDTPQSLSKEMMGNFNIMASILEGIDDEASAKAAVPKIDAVRASMRDIAKRSKGVKTDAATDKAISESMAKEMPAAQSRIAAAMGKLVGQPEVMAILQPAMTGMENDL